MDQRLKDEHKYSQAQHRTHSVPPGPAAEAMTVGHASVSSLTTMCLACSMVGETPGQEEAAWL